MVADLVEAFTAYRKERKPSLDRATLGEDKFVTTRFAAFTGESRAHEMTASVIRKFLDTATSESIARKLYKVTSLMFDCARAERVIVVNPFDEIDRPEVSYKEPGILSPDQFTKRLRYADQHFPELVPFLAVAGFAGVRREEMLREYRDDRILDWSDFLWAKKLIVVRPEVAKKTKRKTGDRRFIPVEPALEHWLKGYRKDSGPVVELSDSWFRKRMALLYTAVEQEPGRNELRHSYASYWLARSEKEGLGRLALSMGNSEAICRKHYVESLSPAEGEAWFEIRRKQKKKPKKSVAADSNRAKVVPFPVAQSA
jgi:integrase